MRACPGRRVPVPWAGLAATLVLAGCALFFEPPDVRIVGVRVASLGLSSGTAELDLEIRNPNRGSVDVRGVRYRLDVRNPEADAGSGEEAWMLLGEGFHTAGTELPGGDTTRVTVEIPFQYDAVGAAVRSFVREGEVRYRLDGELRINGSLGEYQVPLRTSGVLSP